MCVGIQFQSGRRTLEAWFDEGRTCMTPWSRGRGEIEVRLPYGGWAALPSIYAQKWKPYHPRPVLISAIAFHTGNDEDGDAGWFPLDEDMAIQGLAATDRNDELRVYIVTERPLIELPQAKGRWPRMATWQPISYPEAGGGS